MSLDGARFSKALGEQLRQSIIPPDTVRRLADFIVAHPQHASLAAFVWHNAFITAHKDVLPMLLYMAHEVIQRATRANANAGTNGQSQYRNIPTLVEEFYPMVLSGLKHVVKLQDERHIQLAQQFVAVWCELSLFSTPSQQELVGAVQLDVKAKDAIFARSAGLSAPMSSSSVANPQLPQLHGQPRSQEQSPAHPPPQPQHPQPQTQAQTQSQSQSQLQLQPQHQQQQQSCGGASCTQTGCPACAPSAPSGAMPVPVPAVPLPIPNAPQSPGATEPSLSSLLVSCTRAGIFSPAISPYLTGKWDESSHANDPSSSSVTSARPPSRIGTDVFPPAQRAVGINSEDTGGACPNSRQSGSAVGVDTEVRPVTVLQSLYMSRQLVDDKETQEASMYGGLEVATADQDLSTNTTPSNSSISTFATADSIQTPDDTTADNTPRPPTGQRMLPQHFSATVAAHEVNPVLITPLKTVHKNADDNSISSSVTGKMATLSQTSPHFSEFSPSTIAAHAKINTNAPVLAEYCSSKPSSFETVYFTNQQPEQACRVTPLNSHVLPPSAAVDVSSKPSTISPPQLEDSYRCSTLAAPCPGLPAVNGQVTNSLPSSRQHRLDVQRVLSFFNIPYDAEEGDVDVEDQRITQLLSRLFPQHHHHHYHHHSHHHSHQHRLEKLRTTTSNGVTSEEREQSGHNEQPGSAFVTPQGKKGPKPQRILTTPSSVSGNGFSLAGSGDAEKQERATTALNPPSLIVQHTSASGSKQARGTSRSVFDITLTTPSEITAINTLSPLDPEPPSVVACSITPIITPRNATNHPLMLDRCEEVSTPGESSSVGEPNYGDKPQSCELLRGKATVETESDAHKIESTTHGTNGTASARRRKRVHELVVLERVPGPHGDCPDLHPCAEMQRMARSQTFDCAANLGRAECSNQGEGPTVEAHGVDSDAPTTMPESSVHANTTLEIKVNLEEDSSRKRARAPPADASLTPLQNADQDSLYIKRVKRTAADMCEEGISMKALTPIVLHDNTENADIRLKKCLDEYLKLREQRIGSSDALPPSCFAMGAPRTIAELEDDEEIVLLSKLAASRDQSLEERRLINDSIISLAEIVAQKNRLVASNAVTDDIAEQETIRLLNVCNAIESSIRRRRSLVAQLENRIATENRYLQQLDSKRKLCMAQLKAIYREQVQLFGAQEDLQGFSLPNSPKSVSKRTGIADTRTGGVPSSGYTSGTHTPTRLLESEDAEHRTGAVSATSEHENLKTTIDTQSSITASGSTTEHRTSGTPQPATPALSRRTYARLVQTLRSGSYSVFYRQSGSKATNNGSNGSPRP